MAKKPPHLGWAGTVVDALEERIQLLGWNDPSESLGLDDVFAGNLLEVESGLSHLDALVYGVGFVKVGRGDDGPAVTVEPTTGTTGIWDYRLRRLSAALSLDPPVKGVDQTAALYLPDQTVSLVRRRGGGWDEDTGGEDGARDRHGLGRVPVVMVANRTMASARQGHSEVSLPVRDLVDEGSRVLLAMAVNREFFSAPQRLILGRNPDDVRELLSMIGAIWALDADEEGHTPEVTQFPQVKPGPHIEQLKALASQLATVSGVPESYFGVTATANPSSADAIRASEVRLIKKAERRSQMFGVAWLEVARLVCLMNGHTLSSEFGRVSCRWGDPATPTAAAKADEAAKLTGAGILPKRSKITYDRIGLTTAEQDQVEKDWSKQASMADLMATMATRQVEPGQDRG